MAASKGEQAMSESENTIQEQCYGTCWGAQQRIDELTQQLNAANERIKRLESVENSHAAVLNAIDNWIRQYKAKEAKP
jgi:alpha-D-ribose 1-methylphosphonate 5-triphosphate synthase subunit PhnI